MSVDVYTDGSCIGNGSRDAIGGVGVYFGPNDPYNLSESVRTVPSSSSSSSARKKNGEETKRSNTPRGKRKSREGSYGADAEGKLTTITSEATELAACARGIEQAVARVVSGNKSHRGVDAQIHIRLYTDSDYVIYAVTHGEHQPGWREQQQPVDKYFIDRLRKLLHKKRKLGCVVTFVHISAHQAAPVVPYLTAVAHWFGNKEADSLASAAARRQEGAHQK